MNLVEVGEHMYAIKDGRETKGWITLLVVRGGCLEYELGVFAVDPKITVRSCQNDKYHSYLCLVQSRV